MSRKEPSRNSDYRIQWGRNAEVILYTRYKGHNFAGWISIDGFERAEAQGVLTWDAQGNPVIDPDKFIPAGKAVPA